MIKNYFNKVSVAMICMSCFSTGLYAGGGTDSTISNSTTSGSATTVSAPVEYSYLNRYLKSVKEKSTLKTSDFGYQGDKKLGLFKNDIVVSGVLRFLTIYRNMGDVYPDMTTSKSNMSFQDQPLTSVGTAIGAGYPMFELNMASKYNQYVDFNVGYSITHYMSGSDNSTTGSTRLMTNMQNLRVGGTVKTDMYKIGFQAGSILPVKLSKFSMGQPAFRDDYFDRLPWDWYRNSFLRYEEYYSLKLNMGGQNEGRALFTGATMNATIIPLGVNITALYGRTSQTAPYASQFGVLFPSILFGGRLEKTLFTKDVNGKFGANYYSREAQTNNYASIPDNNQMVTVDADLQFKGWKIVSEVAYSKLRNTLSDTVTTPFSRDGFGAQLRAELTRKIFPIHITADAYYIQKNVVSFDGSILNTNSQFRTSGTTTETKYDGNLLYNVVQEIGQYANNRRGISLKSDYKIKKLTIDLGLMISEEIENLNDSSITVQHRVNAFTRSRFHPNFMQAGPYNNIRSVFRRTYENVGITYSDGSKKAFNAAEVLFMYKAKLFGKDFVLMNYHTYNSSVQRLSAIKNNFNDKAFTRLYYSDLTLALKAFKKVNFVGNIGFERLLGGRNTVGIMVNNQLKHIDQTGKSFGLGVDYDFLPTAGLHFRHKWFTQEDPNFVLDKFNGQESYFELKIFF